MRYAISWTVEMDANEDFSAPIEDKRWWHGFVDGFRGKKSECRKFWTWRAAWAEVQRIVQGRPEVKMYEIEKV